jgi:hypothetical protein
MEKLKIRLVVGWRARESKVREIKMRMRHPPSFTPASARVIALKKKP